MKIQLGVIAATVLLLASTVQTFAIEGLKISLQSSNLVYSCPVLSWPSVEGETYIVQYRPTLNTNDSWVTLTNSLPAATGTNSTSYYLDCSMQLPAIPVGLGGDDTNSPPGPSGSASSSSLLVDSEPQEVMAKPVDGSAPPIELAIFPFGFDLSNLMIYDPVVGYWVKGSDYNRQDTSSQNSSSALLAPTGPGPSGPTPDGATPNDTGFYRVVRNGVHFWGLTNGIVLTGVVEVPLEMSLSSTDQITGISFSGNNGDPLVGAREKNGGSPWVMEWDTTMVPNGNYAISAGVDFAGDDSVTNLPVTVTVNNLISFPNYFSRIFGDWMWIYAELATPQADYEIAMYADETNYIGSFTGSTTDGIISFIWDLTDGGGYTFTNETFKGEFHITATINGASGSGPSPADGPTPSQLGTNFWGKEYGWSGLGKFVVAYSAADNNSTKTLKIGSMVSGGPSGEYGGVTQTLGNYGLGNYELSPGNQQGSAFQMGDGASKTELLSYLADMDYRNFYFFGHGAPSSIGGGTSLIPTITGNELQATLRNIVVGLRAANRHPYRLVFIDGCNTASGTLCEKFGMPAQTLNTNFFSLIGVRSRAFLGFKNTITFDPAQWTWRSLMLNGFFADWQNGLPLQACVSNAVAGNHSSSKQKMDSSWVIYGATNLNIFSP